MNIHSFGDVASNSRSALTNDLGDGDDHSDDEMDERSAKLRNPFKSNDELGLSEEARKLNASGEEIEAFDLEEERGELGHFDENMNFIFKKNADTEVDSWLANMNESEMEKSIGEAAMAAAAKKKKEGEKTNRANESDEFPENTPLQLQIKLFNLLYAGESVSDAMRRYKQGATTPGNVQKVEKKPAQSDGPVNVKRERKKKKPDVSATSGNTISGNTNDTGPTQEQQQSSLTRLTAICDRLLSFGLSNVYDVTFESLRSLLFSWQYRLNANGREADPAIMGPFPTPQILAWRRNGFFVGSEAVYMRCLPTQPSLAAINAASNGKNGKRFLTSALPSKKRARFADDATASAGAKDDLMDDLDELGNEEEAVPADTTKMVTVSIQQEGLHLEAGDWLWSDDIEFGDLSTLSMRQAPRGRRPIPEDSDDEDGVNVERLVRQDREMRNDSDDEALKEEEEEKESEGEDED